MLGMMNGEWRMYRMGGGLLKNQNKIPFVCVWLVSHADVVQHHMNKVTFFIVQVPFDKSQKLFFHSSFQFVSCVSVSKRISAMNN
jgi:hypothetical protein